MENTIEISDNLNRKLNLNSIFTPKEIEEIKKNIPKINALIAQNSNIKNKNLNNSNFSKNKISKDSLHLNCIDKDKFIELILEKAKLIFKEENNIILFKSISFIMDEIQKMVNESKKQKKKKLSKITNTDNSTNFDYCIRLNEKNLYSHKNSPSKNPFLVKTNTHGRDYSSRSNSKIKTSELFSYKIKKINANKYRIINNTINNSINNKFIDIRMENDYKMRNIRGNSIINNFITFSNTNQTINTTSNSNLKINKANILGDLNISNNNIYNISGISKFNTFNKKKQKFKNKLTNKIRNQISGISISINDTKTRKSSFNTSKNSNTDKSINLDKVILAEPETQNTSNIKKNENNPFKTFIRLKSENIIDKKDKIFNKNSIKKSNQLTKKAKKVMFRKEIMQLNASNYEIIENKDFDIFEFDNSVGKENTLFLIGNYIYIKLSFSEFINKDKFNNWCKQIAAGYTRKNPYHSDLHGADVAQTCLIYVQYGDVMDIAQLNKVAICSLFLSCFCHDYKHPGVNNNFLKVTKNELAIRYNDLSILENMHISETFKLINQNNDCNIFFGTDSNIYKEIRQKMIECVLSTDMSFHSKHISFMKKIIEINKKSKNKIDSSKYNQEFLNLLIHSADISNPTKPFKVYLKWAKLVLEEFFEQGDKEKALGLPITNDRKTVKLNASQIGFIVYVEEPFISSYILIFPKLKFLQDNIIINKEKFSNYREDEKSKKNVNKTNNNISKKSNLKDSKIKDDNK
jgi:hypothetical protein